MHVSLISPMKTSLAAHRWSSLTFLLNKFLIYTYGKQYLAVCNSHNYNSNINNNRQKYPEFLEMYVPGTPHCLRGISSFNNHISLKVTFTMTPILQMRSLRHKK